MPASQEQQWSSEEDAIIRTLVKQGLQLKQMPPHLPKRTLRGISCHVYALGLKSGNPRIKHSKNEMFWEMPNALNTYYAGLLAADGSVGGCRAILQWTCHKQDRWIMDRFVTDTKFTGHIVESLKKSPASDHMATHCRIAISACQKWNADLARNFNVIPQKAYRLRPPNISTDFLRCCYLIGYTDGDGCIHPGKNGMPQFQYVSASLSIITWIREFVESHFPFKIKQKTTKVRSFADGNYHSYTTYGMTAVKLFEFLRQIDVPRFPRKWDNPEFLAVAQTYRERWPEFFTPDKEVRFDSAGMFVAPILVETPKIEPIYP